MTEKTGYPLVINDYYNLQKSTQRAKQNYLISIK